MSLADKYLWEETLMHPSAISPIDSNRIFQYNPHYTSRNLQSNLYPRRNRPYSTNCVDLDFPRQQLEIYTVGIPLKNSSGRAAKLTTRTVCEGGCMAKFRTDQIRNVAILGHGGSGKTSLTENCSPCRRTCSARRAVVFAS